MSSYATPGVYIEEIRKLPASVAAVETAIPVFIGYTKTSTAAQQNSPVKVTNLLEYESTFGTAPNHGFTIAVTETTDGTSVTNRDISITSAAQSDFMMHYAVQSFYANGGGDCYVLTVGDYSGSVTPATIETAIAKLEQVDRPTLLVFPDNDSVADFAVVYNAALAHCAKMQDRFTIIDVKEPTAPANFPVTDFRSAGIGTSYLNYGAAYYPPLASTFPLVYDEGMTISRTVDANPATTPTLSDLKTSDPNIYRDIVAKLAEYTATIPASGAVAGVYARTDRDRGVWKAPANVSINNISGPTVALRQSQNDDMNIDADAGKSVNAIRNFTGKGTLVWGARTLAGNDNEWRYVPVRRLFIFVEESIKKATEFVVFEPNDANTWLRTKAMIENFLTGLWRQGAFQGATTQEAFYVAVGLGQTMTQDDILNGIMNIEIGLAAVRPAEFIVLKFSHFIQQS